MNTRDDRERLAAEIYRACHLEGHFTLRSGRQATHYFDKYQFEADPRLLSRIADSLMPLIPKGTEVLAGLEVGGIPIVTALSRVSGLPAAFVRKQKKEHGTAKLAEGTELKGKRVTIVEDVVTSGGQIILSTDDIRAIGGKVEAALCVIDRNEGGLVALSEHGVRLIGLFSQEELTDREAGNQYGESG